MQKKNNDLELTEVIQLINNSSYLKAINLLENINKKNNGNFKSYYLLGSLYLKLNKLDPAENNLKKTIQLNDKAVSAYHNLGIVLSLKKDIEASNFYLLKSLDLDPENIETIIELGRNYEIINQYSNAKNYYLKALELDVTSKVANNLLGRMMINEGFHKEGLKYIQKSSGLIRFNKNNFEILK